MCLVSFSKNEDYSSRKKLDGFASKNPRWLHVEITNVCTHKCAWCYGSFNLPQHDHMPVDLFKTMLNKARAMGIMQITLSGGEPTNHPMFEEFVALAAQDFIVNVNSHGDWHRPLAQRLKSLGVAQVQFNYQGAQLHDLVHGVAGAFERQAEAIRDCSAHDLPTVGTTTIGAYNLKNVEQIFREMIDLGIDRLRVWEATGAGNEFRKDPSAGEIFSHCAQAAKALGYPFSQSYDPDFEGDVGVKCLSLAKLYMHVKCNGDVVFCGAVSHSRDQAIASFASDDGLEILAKYHAHMDTMSHGRAPYCAARLPQESIVQFKP